MSDIYSDRRPPPQAESPSRRLALVSGQGTAKPAGKASAAALLQTVERLEHVIELETTALKTGQTADLRDFNTKKSQGLLELNRTLKTTDPLALARDAREPLARLREKLDRNMRILQNHLRAVREVADVIAEAIQEAESDGTYSARHGSWQAR